LVEKRYESPYDNVFEASLRVIRQLGWSLISTDKEAGVIKARTSMSLRSWGEDIIIRLSKENMATIVSVSSHAVFQLFDWGKSIENENLFHEELKKHV
jgi:hypothetical protein